MKEYLWSLYEKAYSFFSTNRTDIEVRKILERFQDQDLSYVDVFTLALIRSRPDIDAIFAFDHHMAFAGLPVLPGSLS